MEVMEDGNLMDKVNILIQRDLEYYKSKQSVLQETICPGIIGGRLDFPRSASFAAVKLVIWWEDEYIAAYKNPSGFFQKDSRSSRSSIEAFGGCGGIVKASDPTKFISAVSKSADQLLEHLHVLTQEALDHADLTVLTGTIGAAALLKNCLWFYIQLLKDTKTSTELLQTGYKKYNEMCEALAERLLDLHCRLLSLYILQDSDCLDWENTKAFFESERGSYIIQMWWLYMQGTREDLWTTVPPKMAQRVFSGMLNESLTILTVRYTQSSPSEARSELLLVDISNLLLCVAQLLPSICDSAEEFIGLPGSNKSKILRDIHVKCHDLFCCFLLRGAPLDTLHKVFRKNQEDIDLYKINTNNIDPWIIYGLPNIFKNITNPIKSMSDLDDQTCLALELMVLLAQPQPNWALLLKVLCRRNFKILQVILRTLSDMTNIELKKTSQKATDCGNFLCPADGSCKNIESTQLVMNTKHYHDLIMACTSVVLHIGNDKELNNVLIETISQQPNWAKCFERRHVWNQIRYSWYEAILNLASPVLPLVAETVINALQTGATMYQAMSLLIACLSQFWDVIDSSLIRVTSLFQEVIPSDILPVSNSVLMQILVSGLYSHFLDISENVSPKKEVSFKHSPKDVENKSDDTNSVKRCSEQSTESLALAVAESLCSIDEDNKHTDQIEEFLSQVSLEDIGCSENSGSIRIENNQQILEILVSDLLLNNQGKKALKTLHHFLKNNSEWLYSTLEVSKIGTNSVPPNKILQRPLPLLHKMFFIGYIPFDQISNRLMSELEDLVNRLSTLSFNKTEIKMPNTNNDDTLAVDWDLFKSRLNNIKPFDGDCNTLNKFNLKCDKLIQIYSIHNNSELNSHIFDCVQEKLISRAEVMVGNRSELTNWESLKAALQQCFSDRRDTDCLVQELTRTRPYKGEDLINFGTRLQLLRSNVAQRISNDLNLTQEQKLCHIKYYEKTALNTFIAGCTGTLKNNMHLKQLNSLEDAMAYVVEFENFEKFQSNANRNNSIFGSPNFNNFQNNNTPNFNTPNNPNFNNSGSYTDFQTWPSQPINMPQPRQLPPQRYFTNKEVFGPPQNVFAPKPIPPSQRTKPTPMSISVKNTNGFSKQQSMQYQFNNQQQRGWNPPQFIFEELHANEYEGNEENVQQYYDQNCGNIENETYFTTNMENTNYRQIQNFEKPNEENHGCGNFHNPAYPENPT
ncbi:uncharacterized protein LOC115886854 [Sitophilus oryzae]|uniref:Uncharacterized protein LOC115886854 n=1 Tax=Sitophilus oryzae TaxID=7048 RepID=A0A6J2YDP4_SITOR|nr:uncharacterized protein LOC115886854 [Sitophilus oryzae]